MTSYGIHKLRVYKMLSDAGITNPDTLKRIWKYIEIIKNGAYTNGYSSCNNKILGLKLKIKHLRKKK